MDLKREPQDKFCIWTNTGHRPAVWHRTLPLAICEASRLAIKQPGDKFLVMHVVDKVWAEKPTKAAQRAAIISEIRAQIATLTAALDRVESQP